MVKQHLRQRKGSWLVLFTMLVIAGCAGGGHSTSTGSSATKPSGNPGGGGSTVPVATIPPNVHPKPVPATYSVYVDPTYHYSVQYPVTWFVQPGIGLNESNVIFSEPVIDPNDPSFPTHPVTQLLVRATDNWQESYVQKLMCNNGGAFPQDLKVGPYPAYDLKTYGGDPVNGYGAPAFGAAFFAKGLAFEIWLQSSAKANWNHDYIQDFFNIETPLWNHIIATFNVGPGAPGGKPVQGCNA